MSIEAVTAAAWLLPASGRSSPSLLCSRRPSAHLSRSPRRLAVVASVVDSTPPPPSIASSADKTIIPDNDFSLAKVSFGVIGLGIGSTLLSYGFGAYFTILPGSEWSALMLTYGFPLAIIGMALKYAELKPVPCLTYSDAQSLRETCATPILKQQQRGQGKEQALVFGRKVKGTVAKDAKHRILGGAQQALPLTTDKPQNSPKLAAKEQTKPSNFKLHTEERAARRAGFNDLVASKISSLEMLRRFEEKIQKVLEEEDIKILRKEMVPKAQLMPFFDRPFLPQRSTRPLTIPKEPSFLMNRKSCGGDERCTYYRYFSQQMKAIR